MANQIRAKAEESGAGTGMGKWVGGGQELRATYAGRRESGRKDGGFLRNLDIRLLWDPVQWSSPHCLS